MATELRTPFCRELVIEYPIFSVGFGISAGPELVQAVSDAGGCGVLGGSGLPAELRRRIARIRDLTNRPFGVNVIIADFEDPNSADEDRSFVAEQIEAAVEARPTLIVLFWGSPAPFVEDAHRNGVKVLIGRLGRRGGGGRRSRRRCSDRAGDRGRRPCQGHDVDVGAAAGNGRRGETGARARVGRDRRRSGTRTGVAARSAGRLARDPLRRERGSVDPLGVQATRRGEQRRGHLLRRAVRCLVAGCAAPRVAG